MAEPNLKWELIELYNFFVSYRLKELRELKPKLTSDQAQEQARTEFKQKYKHTVRYMNEN